jgi:hypothetical protein
MSWYYELKGQPVGPVTEEQMQAARKSGLVDAQSRVWQDGWPDWRPASEVFTSYDGPLPPPVPASTGAGAASQCSECRGYRYDLVSLGGVMVCETCKPRVLEKMREGVTIGAGPWRDGKLLVTLKNTPLPEACLKCGAPPVKKVKKGISWHHPALYVLILIGLLIYLIVALCVRKTATVFVPLCADCNKRRWRNVAISWLSFALAVALFFIAGSVLSGDASAFTAFGGVALLLFSLFWMIGTQLILPQKIDGTYAWVKKAGKPFLDKLPQWSGP